MASRYPVRPCRVNGRTTTSLDRGSGCPQAWTWSWGEGGFTTDYPRDLAVEVAREDGSWTRLAAEAARNSPPVWAGTHVLLNEVERVALRLAPIRARAVCLVQTGEDPVYDWSVAELHLVGP